MVSHSLRELITNADRLVVLDRGKLIAVGSIKDVIESKEFQDLNSIVMPEYLQVLHTLAGRGKRVTTGAYTVEEAVGNIERMMMGDGE
jgi:ABC-type multidrug transport system ATPase subunit